jgi:outer membrane receptor protein involved in Fe transport
MKEDVSQMRFKFFTSLALVFLLGAAGLFAQGTQTGIIRGTVTTADKLSLPGATITIKSSALQGGRTIVTEPDGTFLFRGIPPGTYTLTFEMAGMAPIQKTANVPLGGIAVVDTVMDLAKVQETVNVTGEAPTVLTTPTIGVNLKHEEVEALASRRDLEGIANIAPSVTESTAVNAGQLNINGAFGYDNAFMINGVDVNDNLFGSAQNVFIEDAIQETQVLTSGISAEYGRFSGGVVNAITKSGGNLFSGSLRLNLNNPTWSTLTPYEVSKGITKPSTLNKIYEGTLGGPIVKDKVWFFGAGRYAKTTAAQTFTFTGTPYSTLNDNKREELKATATPAANQTLQLSYINNGTQQTQAALPAYDIDPHDIINRTLPNYTVGASWRGVLRSNLFAEAQFSTRKFGFQGAGGTSKAMVDSPIWSLSDPYLYNAPYFDANDPENRNNRQITGNLSYSVSKAGRHDIKGGYEWFRSQRTGGNSQSATGYVYDADLLTNAAGLPVYDSNGYLIPTWVPGASLQEHWMATLGAELNVDTHSLFIQDHWAANSQLSFDLGLRYEKVRSQSTGGIIGVNTNTVVPRLAMALDPMGNGKTVFHVTYAHYSGRYNEAQIGANSAVGNPAETVGVYHGPAGQGRNFAPALDPANYTISSGSFPTANIFMSPGLSSPLTKEFTVSGGGQIGSKGSAQATYVWRRMTNFIEDFIDIGNGTTHVVQNGVDFGTFTNIVYSNTNVPKRDYQGVVLQGSYRLTPNWQVAGNWTLQLTNDGNFSGEASNQPGIGSIYGNYPGVGTLPSIYEPDRAYPDGHLYDYQKSKLRLWTIYNASLGHYGRLTASGMVRVDSGLTYSLTATSQALTAIQNNLLVQEGYPDAPSSQSVFFGSRGSQFFNGYTMLDASFNYEIPVMRTLRPWLKFDVYNLLNNQELISWNITVKQDAKSPKDAMGLATGYTTGALYGQATSASNYPAPFQGQTGGRTLRVALGFRF